MPTHPNNARRDSKPTSSFKTQAQAKDGQESIESSTNKPKERKNQCNMSASVATSRARSALEDYRAQMHRRRSNEPESAAAYKVTSTSTSRRVVGHRRSDGINNGAASGQKHLSDVITQAGHQRRSSDDSVNSRRRMRRSSGGDSVNVNNVTLSRRTSGEAVNARQMRRLSGGDVAARDGLSNGSMPRQRRSSGEKDRSEKERQSTRRSSADYDQRPSIRRDEASLSLHESSPTLFSNNTFIVKKSTVDVAASESGTQVPRYLRRKEKSQRSSSSRSVSGVDVGDPSCVRRASLRGVVGEEADSAFDPDLEQQANIPALMPTTALIRDTDDEMKRIKEKEKVARDAKRRSSNEIRANLDDFDVGDGSPSCPMTELRTLREEHISRTNDLLFDVFPAHVARALRDGKKVEPEEKSMVTIFFSDIVGYTDLVSRLLTPMQVSDLLDRLYSGFDELSDLHGVHKMETIGDAWMGVTNLIREQDEDHVKRICLFAQDAIKVANETPIDENDRSLGFVNIRVGFHSGPVVATVVGRRNKRYCLFGDTVNVASRMESKSVKNRIQCSDIAADLLHKQAPEIGLKCRGSITVKGKGKMQTYWVLRNGEEDVHISASDEENSRYTNDTIGSQIESAASSKEFYAARTSNAGSGTSRVIVEDQDGVGNISESLKQFADSLGLTNEEIEEQQKMWQQIEVRDRQSENFLDDQLFHAARRRSNEDDPIPSQSMDVNVFDPALIKEQQRIMQQFEKESKSKPQMRNANPPDPTRVLPRRLSNGSELALSAAMQDDRRQETKARTRKS